MGSAKYSNQIEIYSEEVGNGTIKSDGGGGSDIEVVGPPLPPRLPMRPTRITEDGKKLCYLIYTPLSATRTHAFWGTYSFAKDMRDGGLFIPL